MQILDSLIDGPLALENEQEANELIGMIVRYIRTGKDPEPKSDVQKMAIQMVMPVLEKSRSRVVAGSKGGSKPVNKPESKQPGKDASKSTSKQPSKTLSKPVSKSTSKQVSDIYSSSSIPLPNSKEEEGSGEEKESIPYSQIVDYLNDKIGTAYRASSQKTKTLIHSRFAEGFTLDDFKAVIDTMSTEWSHDPKMSVYLRPETLFGTKFESYLNRPKKTRKENRYAAYE